MPQTSEPTDPFIRKFATAYCRYIYDVNTNHFVKVDQAVYAIVDDIHKLSHEKIIAKWKETFTEAQIRKALREIDRAMQQSHLFSRKRPTKVNPYGGRRIETAIRAPIYEHLILNVTENCNLRCRYCVYGGKYPNQRTHSSKRMPRSIAEKALDLFFEKSRRIEKGYIGFYGGEPLGNFDLIRHCVAYVETRQPQKYRYSMTTNGTLLNERVMGFVIENGFNLMISLDGPREVHDRCRVDRRGQRTWDRVMKNVERLYVKSPDYFKRHVTFSAVIVSDRFTMNIKEFFEKHERLSKVGVSTAFPVYTPNRLLDDEGLVAEEESSGGYRELVRQCQVDLVEKSGLTCFLTGLFQREFWKIYHRSTNEGFAQGIPLNGCCFPGHRRLFVSCDGTFHVCERLDNGYPLGNVAEGIRVENVRKLIEDYRELCSACLSCWAVRFCSKCFAASCTGGTFDKTFREVECEAYRNSLERTFVLYHQVLERNPRAFHFLRNVTLS